MTGTYFISFMPVQNYMTDISEDLVLAAVSEEASKLFITFTFKLRIFFFSFFFTSVYVHTVAYLLAMSYYSFAFFSVKTVLHAFECMLASMLSDHVKAAVFFTDKINLTRVSSGLIFLTDEFVNNYHIT